MGIRQRAGGVVTACHRNRGIEPKKIHCFMKDFDKIIWRDALTFVDFFATWCGPCQMMHPVIDKFREQMNGRVDVYTIDIDDRDMIEIIRRYSIRSVPTLLFFRRGEVLWRHSGSIGYEQLKRVLEELEKRENVCQH